MESNTLNIMDRSLIEKSIAGALKSAINDHGPITIENRASTAKRIYCLMKQLAGQQRRDQEDLQESYRRGCIPCDRIKFEPSVIREN